LGIGCSQTIDNELFIHYIDSVNDNYSNRNTLLRMINMDGTIIWQKEYDYFTKPIINKLNDGYLLTGILEGWTTDETKQIFIRISSLGNVIWQYSTPLNSSYINYIHSPSLSVFESNDGIVVFFDNMRCIKLNNSGLLVFEKHFGLSYDVFNFASQNESGSFLILGSRQFDNETGEISVSFTKRDLIVIEVDDSLEAIEE